MSSPYTVPEGYFDTLPERIRSRIRVHEHRKRRRRRAGVAALVLTILLIGGIWLWPSRNSNLAFEDIWTLQLMHTGYDAALLWMDPAFGGEGLGEYPNPEPPPALQLEYEQP